LIVWACSSFHVPSLSLSFYCFLGLQYSLFSHFYSSLCQTFLLSFFPMVSRAFNPLISFDCDMCLSISSYHHYFSFLIFFLLTPWSTFPRPGARKRTRNGFLFILLMRSPSQGHSIAILLVQASSAPSRAMQEANVEEQVKISDFCGSKKFWAVFIFFLIGQKFFFLIQHWFWSSISIQLLH